MSTRAWVWLALGGGILALWLSTLTKAGQSAVIQAESTVSAFIDQLRQIVARFEGLRLDAYQDEAGLWTIGYGHLIKPGEPYFPYGSIRTITLDQASALLDADTKEAQACVAQNVSAPLTDNQRAALVSFVFNVGCGAFTNSTMLQDINAGNFDAATAEFEKWDHVHDPSTGALVESAGLKTRRLAEAALFTEVA